MVTPPNPSDVPMLLEHAIIWDGSDSQWVQAWRRDYKRQKTVLFIDAVIFDNNTATKTSDAFECAPYATFLLLHNLVVASTPTDILIELEFSDDRVNWYKYMAGPFGDLRWEDSAGNKKEAIDGPILAPYVRVKVTATGTTATKTFTSTVKLILSG